MSQPADQTPIWAVNPLLAQVDEFVDGSAIPVCQMLWPTKLRTEEKTFEYASLIAAAPVTAAELDRLRECNTAMLAALRLALPHVQQIASQKPTEPTRMARQQNALKAADAIRAIIDAVPVKAGGPK